MGNWNSYFSLPTHSLTDWLTYGIINSLGLLKFIHYVDYTKWLSKEHRIWHNWVNINSILEAFILFMNEKNINKYELIIFGNDKWLVFN